MAAPTARPAAARSRRTRLMCGAGAVGLLSSALAGTAYALPGLPVSVQGVTPATAPVVGAPIGLPGSAVQTVTLKGSRSLIDWSSFVVGSGDSINFQFGAGHGNWIVLNRVAGSTDIEGFVHGYTGGTTPGGNIWLVSPNGLVVGSSGSLSAGGLLLTTSSFPTTSDAGFLTPPSDPTAPQNFSFLAPATPHPLQIAANARLDVTGGSLALIAPAVNVASHAIVGGDAASQVLYGAAAGYTITFVDAGSLNSGLSLFSFRVDDPSTVATTPLMLAGTTTAGAIYAAGVSTPAAVSPTRAEPSWRRTARRREAGASRSRARAARRA